MKEFSGKVAVVTGAASGIGKATATRFAEEGMKVVLADIEEPALDKAVAELADGEQFGIRGGLLVGRILLLPGTDELDSLQGLPDRLDHHGSALFLHHVAQGPGSECPRGVILRLVHGVDHDLVIAKRATDLFLSNRRKKSRGSESRVGPASSIQ